MGCYSIKLDAGNKVIFRKPDYQGGINPAGEQFDTTNFYLERNGQPFFGICGEFHFSRYDEQRWTDEIIKMKLGGINIISSYVFWIHHEETAGKFDWTGNKNLRRFVEICMEQGLYVIIRIGPFCHGEVRNGGLPDWLYGRPFAVRSNDSEYLSLVSRFYQEIGRQVRGLMFHEGGPVIGVQLENEYQHAGAPWEITTGVNNEWVPAGKAGDAHLRELKRLAVAAGMNPPFFTATAWGGAAVPEDEILPLWGGYAFWPWIFFGDATEHPATPEFLFRDYHNNQIPHCYNFEPGYAPEELPYACCEMGGGMAAYYKYRFQLPPASVSAMSLVKTAGGCNFVGYYMYHGGTNPRGKTLPFLNEHALPKLSYDYQAAIGEFGQLKEHYHRLRLLHYFYRDFAASLCLMKTVLPTDATDDPYDTETLRYAVRAQDDSGYLFLNNYQDHLERSTIHDFRIQLELNSGTMVIPQNGRLTLNNEVSCILPFNLDLQGVKLKYATTQLITQIEYQGENYYFFFIPVGMPGEYCFEHQGISECQVEYGQSSTVAGQTVVTVSEQQLSQIRLTTVAGAQIRICTFPESQALRLWKVDLWGRERLLITEAAVIVPNGGQQLRLEVTGQTPTVVCVFPAPEEQLAVTGGVMVAYPTPGVFKNYLINLPEWESGVQVIPKQDGKAVINFKANTFTGLKELLLQVNYQGDVGNAFIDGELIHDNFSNGAPWEIGLAKYQDSLVAQGMYIYIAPLKKGAYVNNDSTMAARSEVVETEIAEIQSIEAVPVREVTINLS